MRGAYFASRIVENCLLQDINALRVICSAETMLRVWFGAESLFMTFRFVYQSTENTKIPLKKLSFLS
jgi:hypothetical protein